MGKEFAGDMSNYFTQEEEDHQANTSAQQMWNDKLDDISY